LSYARLLFDGRKTWYHIRMTKLLEHAIERVRVLPQKRQNDIARSLMHIAQDEPCQLPLSPQQVAQIKEGIRQTKEGKFASPKRVAQMWRRFGI